MILDLLTVVAPVFVMMGVGAVWGRAGRQFDTDTVGSLAYLVGTPCLIYSSLTSLHIDFASFGDMASAAALSLVCAGLISLAVLRMAGLSITTFLPSVMHPNSGNMGIPLVFLAFGDQGLALAVSFFFVIALSQYTLGFTIASGEVSLAQIYRQPLSWAVALSLITIFTGFTPPAWILKTTTLLGNLTIPLMLILLGVSLVEIKPRDLPLSIGLAFLRLGGGVLTGFIVIHALGLTGPQRGAVFLLCCMPTAVFNFVLAQRFDRMPEKIASLIFVSTLLTLLVMPVLVWAALKLAGT